MLKFKITFEMDEERLRELFEERDLKCTKAKMKELKKDLQENENMLQDELEAKFEEVVDEWLDNMFEE